VHALLRGYRVNSQFDGVDISKITYEILQDYRDLGRLKKITKDDGYHKKKCQGLTKYCRNQKKCNEGLQRFAYAREKVLQTRLHEI